MLAGKSDALEGRKEKSTPVGEGCGRPWVDQMRPGSYKGFSLGGWEGPWRGDAPQNLVLPNQTGIMQS